MLEFFLRLDILLGEPIHIGETSRGYLKIIPIIGGRFIGKVEGKILNYGGDYNLRYDDNRSQVSAQYILSTNTGEMIIIKNEGNIDKSSTSGNITHPLFTLDDSSPLYDLFNKKYIGKIVEGDNKKIVIDIYTVK